MFPPSASSTQRGAKGELDTTIGCVMKSKYQGQWERQQLQERNGEWCREPELHHQHTHAENSLIQHVANADPCLDAFSRTLFISTHGEGFISIQF